MEKARISNIKIVLDICDANNFVSRYHIMIAQRWNSCDVSIAKYLKVVSYYG